MAIPVYHHLIGSCWAQVLALFFVVFWEENYGRTNEKDWSSCMWNDIWTGRMWKQFAGKFWWKSEQLFRITCELSTLRFQHATAYELCMSSRNKAKQKRLSRQMIIWFSAVAEHLFNTASFGALWDKTVQHTFYARPSRRTGGFSWPAPWTLCLRGLCALDSRKALLWC